MNDPFSDVQYTLDIATSTEPWFVLEVHIVESVGQLYHASIRATVRVDGGGGPTDTEEKLLGKDVSLLILRGGSRRRLKGIVKQSRIGSGQVANTFMLELEVVPALWLLTHVVESRIFQDATVSSVVRTIVNQLLSVRSREVESLIQGDEPRYEYIVQYRESSVDFIRRICARDGVFLYFDHDSKQHECLTLANTNSAQPPIDPVTGGLVNYLSGDISLSAREGVGNLRKSTRIGAIDGAVGGYDWTQPTSKLYDERVNRGDVVGAKLQVYQPHQAAHYYDYSDGSGKYESNTIERQADYLVQRLDLARTKWTLQSSVIAAKVGHRIKLLDFIPGAGEDDEYVIVGLDGRGFGSAAAEDAGAYDARLELVPVDVPVRPPAPQRRIVPGPETGVVVSQNPGSSEEIETDKYGRIHVRFHWDRETELRPNSSAWLRVTQMWAGSNWGTLFLPRIGMEVVVHFLGGDPDRPFVSGCLYNKANMPPVNLDAERSKSTIKSNSSIGGNGYNELYFEDSAGNEMIHIHAQKDMDVKILHDRTTSVGNNQTIRIQVNRSLTVGSNETISIGANQTLTVHNGNRTATLEKGDDFLNVNLGNITSQAPNGAHSMIARTVYINGSERIKLVCGASFIEMTPALITVKAGNIKLN